MRIKTCLAVAIVAIAAVSCRQRDIRTVRVHVPAMKNQQCADLIQDVLTRKHGIQPDRIEVDLDTRMLTISYDSLELALKNIEFGIAEAGFQANEVPPDPQAVKALPPECTE